MCTLCSNSSTLPLCTYHSWFSLKGHCPLDLSMYLYKHVCLWMSLASYNAYKYNFQQRISWLSHRWRTQRNAISNVNCRIQWIIESLNAPCAPWYSEEHACLSVMFSLNPVWFFRHELEVEALLDFLSSAPLKYSSVDVCRMFSGVIIVYAAWTEAILISVLLTVLCWTNLLWHLTSNQVGLPAELKHINKRRKRN